MLVSKKQPAKIIATYTDDYDIVYIHNITLTTLQNEKSELPHLNSKLTTLYSLLQKPQTYNSKRETEEDIKQLENTITQLKNNTRLNDYIRLATPIIDNYKMLKSSNIPNMSSNIPNTSNTSTNIPNTSNTSTNIPNTSTNIPNTSTNIPNTSTNILNTSQSLLSVIDKYLKLAKKYIDINICRKVETKDCCLNCKAALDANDIIVADGIIKCPKCFNEHQMIHTSKNSDGVKEQNLNTENDMENFVKALTRYQGLQPNPPLVIYTKLDTYFRQRALPTSDKIRLLPYNDEGKKGNTNKEMLCQALSNVGYASYYEDVNLIGHIYWDWKLPDLTGLQDTILHHYAITQKAFYKIPLKVRGRISSLGTQYRLFRHLQLVGHICHQDDFKIAENVDSLQNHHRLWRMMCDLANDPEILINNVSCFF